MAGLQSNFEGNVTRFNYSGVGGAGTTLQQAVSGNDYLQFQFTTPATLNPRTFFKRTGFGSWVNESYEYAVRVSTSPKFATYWTLIQDQRVTGGGGYAFRPANTTRFPLLQPSTTYYIRAYLYDRTVNFTSTNAASDTITADDFQFGTGVCPVPTVTVSKVSVGGTGSFAFSGGNGFDPQAIATTAPGTAVAAPLQVLDASNAITTISEAAPLGFVLTNIACTGLPSGTPVHTINGANGGNVQMPASAMTSTADILGTFTNGALTDLVISKSNTYSAAQPTDFGSDTVTGGATTQYTLVVTNNGVNPVAGAVVRDAAASRTGLTCQPAGTVSCTGSAAGVCPSNTTVGALDAGFALGTLPAGGTATFSFICSVNWAVIFSPQP